MFQLYHASQSENIYGKKIEAINEENKEEDLTTDRNQEQWRTSSMLYQQRVMDGIKLQYGSVNSVELKSELWESQEIIFVCNKQHRHHIQTSRMLIVVQELLSVQ